MGSIRKDYAEAEYLCHRSLELEPEDVSTNINYAELLVVLRRYDEAAQYANRTLELEQGVAEYFAVAQLFFALLDQLGGVNEDNWLRRLKDVVCGVHGAPRASAAPYGLSANAAASACSSIG